jgi:translation initiation factor 1
MKKKSPSSHGIVYSTDPSFRPDEEEITAATLPPAEQPLRILLDKKQRAGKVVTLVTGFIGNDTDLQSLGKQLRNYCGTGGSAKDGEVMVQGDQREKVNQWLQKNGYRLAKRVG